MAEALRTPFEEARQSHLVRYISGELHKRLISTSAEGIREK